MKSKEFQDALYRERCRREAVESEVRHLRMVCEEVYLVCSSSWFGDPGYCEGHFMKVLENLKAAANGEKIPHNQGWSGLLT
jgi:hypothetical protein